MIRTIERKFYKKELIAILKKQIEFHKELNDSELYNKCINDLYLSNKDYRKSIDNKGFLYLFVNDIIFYQRPLKTKKSLIADCPYEYRKYEIDVNGVTQKVKEPLKCIAKSNPLFQEFRLWQFISNLKIYQKEKIIEKKDAQLDLFSIKESVSSKILTDVDVTSEFLKNDEDKVKLFEWLNDRATIKQDILLSSYFKISKPKGKDTLPYRWNYVEDKEYPCNKTRAAILAKLQKNEKDKLPAIGKSLIDKCLKNLIDKRNGVSENRLKQIDREIKELQWWNQNKKTQTQYAEYAIWHLLYSITTQAEIDKALNINKEQKDRNGILAELSSMFSDETIQKIKGIKFDEKDYGSYSEKAIKKLLSLMRMGKYWLEDNIDDRTKARIEKIITGEYDETICSRVREKAITLNDVSMFQGLPLWLACYVVYDRHSEAKEIEKWEKPEDIDDYLRKFKQHSLRNPIVEQVVTETLRTVRDIWKKVGKIDEIHIELAREMKKTAEERKKMTDSITQNENTNLRIKAMLQEFINPEYGIADVRPYSPSQQEILKIYENYALSNLSTEDKDFEFIDKIRKNAQPTSSEVLRYKCWLEQKYRSPYTGKIIPLAELFTSKYEIEHIIPQSVYFDDSFNNKVICESEVNKLKDNSLAYPFIVAHQGEIVEVSGGEKVKIFTIEAYEIFVKDNYSRNNSKKNNLLLTEIPEKFIARQMNDTRYISKFMKGVLSNIVREKDDNGEYEQEATSKNLISCSGSITDRLKKDWGMNDVWNRIILPRFERMNEITGKDCFTTMNLEGHIIPDMPFELQKGFNKKRIDHRHHAMDALVIACTTRDHVNLLNNEAAKPKNKDMRYQLSHKLRRYEKEIINGEERNVPKEFVKPWETFTEDLYEALSNIVVSFKQNLRVINKTSNYYQKINEENKKVNVKQEKGDSWAIRKSMHKDTVFGEVNLRFTKQVSLNEALKNPKTIVNKDLKHKILELISENYDAKKIKKYLTENNDIWSDVNIAKIDVYYYTKTTNDRYFATRKDLISVLSGAKTLKDAKSIIESITDVGIQKILFRYLEEKDFNPAIAFSADGIDEMNRNIVKLNGGKPHQIIKKVRVFEKANKFAVGQIGNKKLKFVEADKGTNLFFVIYQENVEAKTGEIIKTRTFLTIPLNLVIDCQKKGGNDWQSKMDEVLKERKSVSENAKLMFVLSPNDLVYLPTEEQVKTGITNINKDRIYKMVSCTGNECHFIPISVAKSLIKTLELGSNEKAQRAWTGEMIKETCVPIEVDRLGNIKLKCIKS